VGEVGQDLSAPPDACVACDDLFDQPLIRRPPRGSSASLRVHPEEVFVSPDSSDHSVHHGAFGNDRFGVVAERFARFFGTRRFVIGQTVLVGAALETGS
jgi:hypothetical protein